MRDGSENITSERNKDRFENMPVDRFFARNNCFADLCFTPPAANAVASALPETEYYAVYGGLDEHDDGTNKIEYVAPNLAYNQIRKITNSTSKTKKLAAAGMLIILYECSCNVPKSEKLKHHPNYDKLEEVMLLCRKCHAAEHKRLRSLTTTARAVNE